MFNVGDKVTVIEFKYGQVRSLKVTVVETVMKAKVTIRNFNARFNPNDGWMRKSDGALAYRIVPWKQEHSDEIKRNNMILKLHNFDWKYLPTELLSTINILVDNVEINPYDSPA